MSEVPVRNTSDEQALGSMQEMRGASGAPEIAMKNTAIQWATHTFNPWEGCTKVAPECKNCYAETMVDHRFGRAKWGKGQPRRRTGKATWRQPLAWNRESGEQWNARPRVFCLSLGDWLDEEVPIEWLGDLLKLIHETRNLDWLLLTKRPQNWRERVNGVNLCDETEGEIGSDFRNDLARWYEHGTGPFMENIWIGVSAGADQRAALDIPAKIHFLSCEPMLHPMDYRWAAAFKWIIFGGESGKNARGCDVDWIRDGITFCQHYGIAPFVKQLGAKPYWLNPDARSEFDEGGALLKLKDSHGGNWDEWPPDLRIRELPEINS